MKNPDSRPKAADDLRQKAEALARERIAGAPEDSAALAPEDIRKTLHELRVHQIEQAMQNEELRTAQARMEAGQARYFDLYDLAPVGYCTLSEKGLILEANLTAATLLGTPRNSLIKQPISRFVLEEDHDIYYLHRKRLFESGGLQECELRLVKPDGTNVWAHLTATAAQAEDGAPVCRVVLIDITERMRAENELRAMVERYRFASKAVNDVIWDWDIIRNAQQWNEAGTAVFGWTEIVERPVTAEWWVERVHPDDQERVRKSFFSVANSPELDVWHDEYRFRKADGTYAFVMDRGYVLRDEEGKAIRMIGAMQDITDRKQAEDDLRRSRHLLTATEALSAVGGWEWDVATETMTWTDGTYHIHDFEPSALPAGSPEHIARSLACYAPEDQPRVVEAFRRCVEEGEPYNLECGFTTAKGRRLCVRTMGRAIREGGRIVKVIGNLLDITERKQAEEALKKSEATVKRKLKAILEPDGDIGAVNLADIIDQEELQRLMDDLFRLTGAGAAILDTQGNVLASCGWQDICARFHRAHPVTRQNCRKSDTALTSGTAPGEWKLYQCGNGMWDVVTPVHIGGNHIGNVFFGQFFFEDESPDYDRFRRQARQYGFDEEAYLAALARVPRWSREKVDRIMAFYARLAATISMQGYGNLKLARSLTALRESEKLLSRAQEIAHTGSWILDITANRSTWSDEVYRILGCHPQEFAPTHKAFLDFVHPDDRAAVDEAHSRSLREASDGYEIEHRVVRRNSGKVRYVHQRCIHERDATGAVIQTIGMVQDITERRRAEEALLETNRQLEAATVLANEMAAQAGQASIAKSEFLANMSHEIRTPMTAILGFAAVALERCPGQCSFGEGEHREHLQTIVRNGEYLINLINDILDLSKVEAGKLGLERISCSPSLIVAEVESLVRVRSSAKGLQLRTAFEGPTPEAIASDPTRLRQILINLVGNAVKFTETGHVSLITRLGKLPGGESVLEFDVLDTGVGMTPAEAAKLFQPFSQADTSTTRKFGGTGLGLAVSKRLAEALGGDVRLVETEPGVGSRFRLAIPTGPLDGIRMLDQTEQTRQWKPEKQPTTTRMPTLPNCRILLAEDGVDNQRLIGHLLKRAGAQVTICENGKLAAEAALDAGSPFDAILMDMQMPVMDGYEATALLRRQGYTGPIIALTAHAMGGDRQKCLDAGCDDYLSKPMTSEELFGVIARHVNPP